MSDEQINYGQALSEIKPCPFCGSDSLDGPHRVDYMGDYYQPHYWLECEKCPAGMQVEGETPNGLIKAWNKRS